MPLKKRILAVLSLIILITLPGTSEANHRWNLLEGYVHNPSEFKEFEIGKKIVYWHQRMIDEAKVEKDQIVFHFDRESRELIDAKMYWRDYLPSFLPKLTITKEQAESMVEGTVEFCSLYIISPKSDVFPIKPTPENPCWVVASTHYAKGPIRTVIDAVEGKVLGYGIAPPYTAFSLSGPKSQNPCTGVWNNWYENAQEWFDTMGYFTEAVVWPTEEKVQSHIQSKSTAMFYELAHGWEELFSSGCDGGFYESTTALEIENWISSYNKMPFTFLGSCDGMCETVDDTLSFEFRKGSIEDTATVGYCHMAEPQCDPGCWSDTVDWQDAFFSYLNDGDTVKEAFDKANADYPACFNNQCMRFAGDENFAVVPVVFRVYDSSSHWKFDETSGTTAYDSAGDNHGTVHGAQWGTGKIDGALDFDGVDDYVSLYPISSLGSSTVTVSAWIKADDISSGLHPIVTQYRHDGSDYYGYYFYLGDNKPKFFLAGVKAESSDSVDTTDWYHLAGTNDGQNLKIYLNGILKGTCSSVDKTGGCLDPYIGYDGDGNYFDGKIDDVRVYNYALDIFEIWDIMFPDTSRFRIQNYSSETVAWFDDLGNLFLKGSLTEDETPSAWGNWEFKVKIDSSNAAAIIKCTTGDMVIKGFKHEKEKGTLTPPSGSFIIKNSSDTVFSYIDASAGESSGHLYLKGKLYQNDDP